MDREEVLALLQGGPSGIKRWNVARSSGEGPPDLSGAHLQKADLRGVDLRHAKLVGADLRGALLANALLHRANLRHARLRHANLDYTDLSHAKLREVDLHSTILFGTNMHRADLRQAGLQDVDLRDVDLREASLVQARFVPFRISGANFAGARFGDTVIGGDLSHATGLESATHVAPSHISVDAVLRLGDELPESFLRGCGVRDQEIAYFRSVVGSAVRFYSCFISYSSEDEEFATRLHNDFQAAGIRCWKWDHDARTGRSLWGEIDQAIRKYDKLVLIASEASLKSPAVNREIERAICQEDAREKQNQAGQRTGSTDVLFPVRLDDFIFDGWEHERKVDVTKKVIADARGWDTDPAAYARVRDKLIKDLKPD